MRNCVPDKMVKKISDAGFRIYRVLRVAIRQAVRRISEIRDRKSEITRIVLLD